MEDRRQTKVGSGVRALALLCAFRSDFRHETFCIQENMWFESLVLCIKVCTQAWVARSKCHSGSGKELSARMALLFH